MIGGRSTGSGGGPITHLLCGVDGSEAAYRAAELAARLALTLNARLTFLVVAPEAKASAELERFRKVEGLDEEPLPSIPVEADACLERAIGIARRAGVSDLTARVMTGDGREVSTARGRVHRSSTAVRETEGGPEPASTICSAARSLGADCIVLGRHRRGAVSAALRASTARRIGDDCDCPVLSVA